MASYSALNALLSSSVAVSPVAATVQTYARRVMAYGEQSESLFGQKNALISNVWDILDECSKADWDGEGSEPVNSIAAAAAAAFIRALPADLPLPEISPEPDGALSLDWVQSRFRRFSLSMTNQQRIPFAWLDGSDRGHGVAQFNCFEVPERIIEGIKSIMSHGDTAVGLA